MEISNELFERKISAEIANAQLWQLFSNAHSYSACHEELVAAISRLVDNHPQEAQSIIRESSIFLAKVSMQCQQRTIKHNH